MSFRIWAYNNLDLQFPNNKPLWKFDEGLQHIVNDDGSVMQLFQQTPQEIRKNLFDTMTINQNIVNLNGQILVSNVPLKVKLKVDNIFKNKERYQNISSLFSNPIRWYHIALIHELECTQNFNCYLGNGQPLNKKTTIVPKGRGPFISFEDGAIDAIKYDKLDKILDWSIGNTLYVLEGFNGYGYALYRHINSPYLWSGSNQYVSGKYIADNVYSKNAVSSQIGVALLLKEILNRLD